MSIEGQHWNPLSEGSQSRSPKLKNIENNTNIDFGKLINLDNSSLMNSQSNRPVYVNNHLDQSNNTKYLIGELYDCKQRLEENGNDKSEIIEKMEEEELPKIEKNGISFIKNTDVHEMKN